VQELGFNLLEVPGLRKGECMAGYDWFGVGAGLHGAVFSHGMTKRGKPCLVLDRRCIVGGNCYTHSPVVHWKYDFYNLPFNMNRGR